MNLREAHDRRILEIEKSKKEGVEMEEAVKIERKLWEDYEEFRLKKMREKKESTHDRT